MSSGIEENQPLLGGQNVVKRSRRKWSRLVAYSTFGILFLVAYNLVFLPRTSVSRDWRRLHSVKLSFSDIERSLFQSIDPDSIKGWSEKYTSEIHLAGKGYDLVEWTRDKFEEYGIKSKIETYDIYLNYPYDHSLKLLNTDGSVNFTASLKEDKLEEDPTSNLDDNLLVPTFHGYSASGNATGQLIYANLGRKQDYDLLVEKGVDFKDKIVIVRYGGIFRGLKVKFAEDLGAAGVLIYSDPAEDGEIIEKNGYKPYPEGPARNPSAVQRGSVQYLSYAPGDPTTIGWASKGDVKRESPEGHIPVIPSLPISYRDALPLLKQLNGNGLKGSDLGNDWVGALDEIEYNVGPSELEVNLYNMQDYDIRPTWNVIGRIDGIIEDEAIVIGNHRDAWIAGGAVDPNSGSALLVEVAKAFGDLLKQGWKPMRTIILASWDGEEYGLLGSTEWGEDHAKYLKSHVLAYINVDDVCNGPHFSADASPLLSDIIRKVAKRVPSIDGESSVYQEWYNRTGARVNNLGSGSDYTVFQDYLGIPSVNIGFGPNATSPVYHYHSNYDSFHWMEKFGDPSFKCHATAAKLWGLLTVSLTEQELIAFKLTEYSELLQNYVNEVELKIPLDSPLYDASVQSFDDLQSDIGQFIEAAIEYDKYTKQLDEEYTKEYPWYKFYKKLALLIRVKVANYRLFKIERLFLYEKGLDNRSWFKHVVFAPGRYRLDMQVPCYQV